MASRNRKLSRMVKLGLLGGLGLVGFLVKLRENIYSERANEPLQMSSEEIITSLEKKLGIKSLSKPKIVYGSSPRIEKSPLDSVTAGSYEAEEKTIYINPSLDLTEAQETLKHEFGHFYMDNLAENAIPGNYPAKKLLSELKTFSDTLNSKLIREGIARYFERKGTINEAPNFSDYLWPKDFEFSSWDRTSVIYEGGYHLVKPILDIDVRRGIELLITNPMTRQDLLNLPAYQQRIKRMMMEGGK